MTKKNVPSSPQWAVGNQYIGVFWNLHPPIM